NRPPPGAKPGTGEGRGPGWRGVPAPGAPYPPGRLWRARASRTRSSVSRPQPWGMVGGGEGAENPGKRGKRLRRRDDEVIREGDRRPSRPPGSATALVASSPSAPPRPRSSAREPIVDVTPTA